MHAKDQVPARCPPPTALLEVPSLALEVWGSCLAQSQTQIGRAMGTAPKTPALLGTPTSTAPSAKALEGSRGPTMLWPSPRDPEIGPASVYLKAPWGGAAALESGTF